LNNLAAIIQDASQIPIEGNPIDNTHKKHHLDEDDDTSKQATQNYDLNDIEQEVCMDFFFTAYRFLLFTRKIFILFVNSNRILTK